MLLGELDLVHLLRSGRAGIKQSEIQKRRQQHSQEAPTRGYRVPVSNERHGMVLHLAAAQGSPMFRLVNVSPRSVAHAGEQAYDRFTRDALRRAASPCCSELTINFVEQLCQQSRVCDLHICGDRLSQDTPMRVTPDGLTWKENPAFPK